MKKILEMYNKLVRKIFKATCV